MKLIQKEAEAVASAHPQLDIGAILSIVAVLLQFALECYRRNRKETIAQVRSPNMYLRWRMRSAVRRELSRLGLPHDRKAVQAYLDAVQAHLLVMSDGTLEKILEEHLEITN